MSRPSRSRIARTSARRFVRPRVKTAECHTHAAAAIRFRPRSARTNVRLTTADDGQKPCRYPQRHARTAAPPLPPPPLAVGQSLRGPNKGSVCQRRLKLTPERRPNIDPLRPESRLIRVGRSEGVVVCGGL